MRKDKTGCCSNSVSMVWIQAELSLLFCPPPMSILILQSYHWWFIYSLGCIQFILYHQWKTQVIIYFPLIDKTPSHKKEKLSRSAWYKRTGMLLLLMKFPVCTQLSSVYHFQYFRSQSTGPTAYIFLTYAVQFSGLGCRCISNDLVTYPQAIL